MPQPFIPFLHFRLQGHYIEVVQPSSHADLYFPHDLSDIDSAVLLRDCSQPVFRFQHGFGMDSNEQFSLSLAVCTLPSVIV